MLINEQLVKRVITPRPKISHKGTFGRIVLIGGNEQYGDHYECFSCRTQRSGSHDCSN